MQDVRNLRVWHLARTLALGVVEALPPTAGRRVPGLRHQAIRAAMSIGSNIAEGCGHSSRAEFLRFIDIALGSTNELENHLLFARDSGVISPAGLAKLGRQLAVVRKMLLSLSATVRENLDADTRSPTPDP